MPRQRGERTRVDERGAPMTGRPTVATRPNWPVSYHRPDFTLSPCEMSAAIVRDFRRRATAGLFAAVAAALPGALAAQAPALGPAPASLTEADYATRRDSLLA